MKIDRPSYKELREHYLRNRDYFDQLSGYYSLSDPEYHRNNFLHIEKNFDVRKYGILKRISQCCLFLFGILLLVIYLFPFSFQTDTDLFEIREYSCSVIKFELSDFDKGMNKLQKNQFLRAKTYFENVSAEDENFSSAARMIYICEEEIEKDILSEYNYDYNYDSENIPFKDNNSADIQ